MTFDSDSDTDWEQWQKDLDRQTDQIIAAYLQPFLIRTTKWQRIRSRITLLFGRILGSSEQSDEAQPAATRMEMYVFRGDLDALIHRVRIEQRHYKPEREWMVDRLLYALIDMNPRIEPWLIVQALVQHREAFGRDFGMRAFELLKEKGRLSQDTEWPLVPPKVPWDPTGRLSRFSPTS